MELPAKPPRLRLDEKTIESLRAPNSDVATYVQQANHKYWHWDELRHRPMPPGLAPDEAWTIVKLNRRTEWSPLVDERGRPFVYSTPTRALQILHGVDREGGNQFPVDDQIKERTIIGSLMEEAIASSQLEGAAVTRVQAKEMLRSGRAPRDVHEKMIVNNYRTIQLLRNRLDVELTPDLLFEIHASMTEGTMKDSAVGRYRGPDEPIAIEDVRDGQIVFTPPPAEALPDRMSRFFKFAQSRGSGNSFMHPLVKAAILHFWLAYEHPFTDGNGRTARALVYWHMLREGYWLFEFLTISRVIHSAPMAYYRSFLHTETDDNDLTYSILHMLTTTEKAFASLRAYVARKQLEQKHLKAALRGMLHLNHRQRAVLEEALRDGNRRFTIRSHQTEHRVSYPTAHGDLQDLCKRGLLIPLKIGREIEFLSAEDLSALLAKAGV